VLAKTQGRNACVNSVRTRSLVKSWNQILTFNLIYIFLDAQHMCKVGKRTKAISKFQKVYFIFEIAFAFGHSISLSSTTCTVLFF